MAKDKGGMLPKEAMEQPPRSSSSVSVSNMPGKMKGDKMPHEIMNDKMAKGLGC